MNRVGEIARTLNIKRANWRYAWTLWIVLAFGSFAVLETMAILDPALGDTLSENIRSWFHTNTVTGALIFGVALSTFFLWFLVHILGNFGRRRLKRREPEYQASPQHLLYTAVPDYAPVTWDETHVYNIVDADSFDAVLTGSMEFHFGMSFDGHVPFRCRLARINAYPSSSALGKTGKSVTATKILGKQPIIITVEPYKYGAPKRPQPYQIIAEWMVEVIIQDDAGESVFLSDYLVNKGLALYWDGQGPRPGGINFV